MKTAKAMGGIIAVVGLIFTICSFEDLEHMKDSVLDYSAVDTFMMYVMTFAALLIIVLGAAIIKLAEHYENQSSHGNGYERRKK